MVDSRSTGKQAVIDGAQVDALFEALNDEQPGVCAGALRLLANQPLPKSGWYRLAEIVGGELELFPPHESGQAPQFEFPDLLYAAMRIPVSTVRGSLYPFLSNTTPSDIRRQVIEALALAGDRVTVEILLDFLKKDGLIIPQQAAFLLAHQNLYAYQEPLKQLAVLHADPLVRFWLCLALIRLGEFQAFETLVIQSLEGKIERIDCYGNPFVMAQQIAECGPFLEEFSALLLFLMGEGELAEMNEFPQLAKIRRLLLAGGDPFNGLDSVVHTLIHEGYLKVPPTEQAGWFSEPVKNDREKAAKWEGSLIELADELIQYNRSARDVLPLLSAVQKNILITAWFKAIANQLGKVDQRFVSGNGIIGLPGWFWQDFEPDFMQLYEAYFLIVDVDRDLLDQLAWVISRAGKMRLFAEYLPLLEVIETDQKAPYLQFLLHVIRMADQRSGPVFGAGSESGETPPLMEHFIDYEEAVAGDENVVWRGIKGDEPIEKEPPRYVQGEVFDLSDPVAPQSLNQAFLAGKKHLLKVWLGKLEAGAIAAPQPIQLDTLPDQPSWEFEVYFWEPNHAPAVQIQPLTVYRKQAPLNPLTICEFTFTPRAAIPAFQGRLAVVYKQNILQMLFLEGKVVADAAAGANDAIQFKWAEVKGVRSPEQLEEFDLVFYNESDPLQGQGLMFFGGEAGLKQVNGLEAGIQDMIKMLKEAGQPGKASLEERKESLIVLANQGSMLYNAMLEQIGNGNQALLALRSVTRLQLVSARRDVFPLELIYVYTPPNPDASLCPNAQQAILTGTCAICNGLDEQTAAGVICPLGFLGMRCAIERHILQDLKKSEAMLRGADYKLLAGITVGEKTLGPFDSCLCAFSNNVDIANQKMVTRALEEFFPNESEFALNWDDWKLKMDKKPASMLVLMPHTLKYMTIPSLEIGKSNLWCTKIDGSVVGFSKTANPLVLLIGCETAVPETPYQQFAAFFANAGAAITVMTLAPIHESRAAPITKILVEQVRLCAKEKKSFGEALLQTRRVAMSQGYGEVLSLVADGDADWVLTEG